MEKFFIVTEASQLHKEYFEYKENRKTVHDFVNEFTNKYGIESAEYYPSNECLMIVPTKADIKKFGNMLKKEVSNGLRPFKVNSSINKDWVNLLKERGLTIKHRPMLGLYFVEIYGKHSSRLFDINGILYCSFENSYDKLDTPEGFTEIKASEFYKIIEEYENKANE